MTRLWTEAGAWRDLGDDIVASGLFLTRLPLARFAAEPMPPLNEAMRAFPLIGLGLGAIGGLLLWGLVAIGSPTLLASAVAIAFLVVITGALHEDGLADVADGFGGGADTERKLAIMRDSRIGTYGVIALVLVLLVKAASLSDIAGQSWYQAPAVLAATGAFSRSLVVWLMGTTSPARLDGLSAASGQPSSAVVTFALVAGGVAAGLFLLISAGVTAFVAAFITGFTAAAFLRLLSLRQIGGQTGDVCGAVQAISETAMLAAIAIATS